MGLFNSADIAKINQVAARSKQLTDPPVTGSKSKSISSELSRISEEVKEYFADSPAILITDTYELHEYISAAIECGYVGIDTETTGLDRIKDHVVGASLYYPGGTECYIPMKHLVPIFDEPYRNQLSYEAVGEELQRFVDANTKMIFANADFDLAMIYKDLQVDMCDICYYDVILAWRCLKENEKDNALKVLYNKYVMKGKGDPKKFTDFFTPAIFPYSKPEVAGLYAANDAKITYELFKWQLPYITKDHPKCKKHHLEAISDLIWGVEFPLIKVCQMLHRTGMFVDKFTSAALQARYKSIKQQETQKLADMVDEQLANATIPFGKKALFTKGSEFNPNSPPQVKYLLYTIMGLPVGPNGGSTDKEVLKELNLPITDQLLKVRSLGVLISTFVEKMPNATTLDSRIHAQFISTGADTGRFSSRDPNLMNIPSHATDIRHMFRATPGYVMLSSDYSQQEPRLTAFVSRDPNMIKSFQDNKDIYATIASLAFNTDYNRCLEFHPETKEYQPDGKARRNEAKTILLGLTYGRSIPSIAEQLYGKRDDMSDEEKLKSAQKIYDAFMNAFPNVKAAMLAAQNSARRNGYTETILGRRRHLPDMQLSEFEFKALPGYVNPDIDPLDISTLSNKTEIPERIVKELTTEFKGYKYFSQIARRTRELYDEYHIKVLNNRPKINDATRQCLNCVDFDTEILTTAGWKHYDEISKGDTILSYNLETQHVEIDSIQDITVSNDEAEVVEFNTPTFNAVSTMNHRWVVGEANEIPRIKYTYNIYNNKWPDYPILRVADNSIVSSCNYTDDQLKILGWILTDGSYSKPYYGVQIFQSTNKPKNDMVYHFMLDTLNRCNMKYSDRCSDTYNLGYHTIYLNKCEFTLDVLKQFPERQLTYEFISTLDQHQANILMWSMIEGDGTLGENNNSITYTCSSRTKMDLFQYLAFVAGHATNGYEVAPEQHNSTPSSNIVYESVSNSTPIHITQSYFTVSVLRVQRAQIYPHHKSISTCKGVWCPTTNNGTWIARRNNKVFITGNSVIQGSAAEQTKMAILMLVNDPEWIRIGGRLLTPVHDELIAEVPLEYWKEGGEILSRCMVDAANFLPFPSKCDVTTTLRWYGLEYPCKYSKPTSLDTVEPDEIKWIQYHLYENEYLLPVFNNKDGSKPRGDAALGVNGVISDEYDAAIEDYKRRFNLESDMEFITHIERKVIYNEY